jgi:hypothetical protein|tara:strand:+ start:638 stop:751 length:114 start_codon:yes stop_codon:yes gene_type:complete
MKVNTIFTIEQQLLKSYNVRGKETKLKKGTVKKGESK